MREFKKVLYTNYATSPLAWRDDKEAKTHIEIVFYFDFKSGPRFSVKAGNVVFCEHNLFKALLRCLEHESIGMAKYDWLKEDTRRKGFWQKL